MPAVRVRVPRVVINRDLFHPPKFLAPRGSERHRMDQYFVAASEEQHLLAVSAKAGDLLPEINSNLRIRQIVTEAITSI